MDFVDRFVQSCQDTESLIRDARYDDAAISFDARAGDLAARLKPIEQARYIRVAVNHPLTDLSAGEAFAARPSQDTQDVILRERQVRRLERIDLSTHQAFSSEKQVEVNNLFQTPERLLLFKLGLQSRTHEPRIVLATTFVKKRESRLIRSTRESLVLQEGFSLYAAAMGNDPSVITAERRFGQGYLKSPQNGPIGVARGFDRVS
jgi:hypothetical protein